MAEKRALGDVSVQAFGWGRPVPLPQDPVVGWLFSCLCSTVELGIGGSELSPKDIIQLAEAEK